MALCPCCPVSSCQDWPGWNTGAVADNLFLLGSGGGPGGSCSTAGGGTFGLRHNSTKDNQKHSPKNGQHAQSPTGAARGSVSLATDPVAGATAAVHVALRASFVELGCEKASVASQGHRPAVAVPEDSCGPGNCASAESTLSRRTGASCVSTKAALTLHRALEFPICLRQALVKPPPACPRWPALNSLGALLGSWIAWAAPLR